MEQHTLQVVTEFVNAVQQVNLEKLGVLLHPEITWDQPAATGFPEQKNQAEKYSRW